ncbi:hypothetical protein KKD61_01435, partial [Patescibacteria group bacterium]|nr:hypothetical protein [Patescibacteria group bacterium]
SDGRWSGSVKARVKSSSDAGNYQLVIRLKKDENDDKKDSQEYPLSVGSALPASTNTPTSTPTKAPTLTPTNSVTPTKTPTPTKEPTPSKEASPSVPLAGNEESGLFYLNTPTPESDLLGEVLGADSEAFEKEGKSKSSKVIAAILIALGGGLIASVFILPKLKANFGKMDQSEEE